MLHTLRFPNQDDKLFDEGYDSDVDLLYYDEKALNEDPEEFFEASIEDIMPIPVPAPMTETETNALTEDEAKKMKVADLKEALKKQGKTT